MMMPKKFMDTMLKIVPDEPIMQSRYIYYLTAMVFFGLLSFSVATWWAVFTTFSFQTLGQAVFMSAISLLSMVGLKQSRAGFLMTKEMVNNTKYRDRPTAETAKEMLEGFD